MTHSDSHLLRLRILTTELWEIIFHQLSSTHDLRRLATVCATFNALCIRIFQVPPQIQGLSFRVLPFWRPRNSPRSCACTPSGVVDNKPKSITADLSVLRNFVLPSERLRELRLSFGDDLFSPPVAPSSESPLDAFCALLSAMAGAPSPAIVVSFNKISSCRREDTDQVQSHPEVPLRARSTRRSENFRQLGSLLRLRRGKDAKSGSSTTSPVRLDTGKPITSLGCACIYTCSNDSNCRRNDGENEFNTAPLSSNVAVPAAALSAALASVRLPRLHGIDIALPGIAPAALGSLLWNHSGVNTLTHRGGDDENLFSEQEEEAERGANEWEQNPLVSPALAHIGLSHVETVGSSVAGHMITVLAACPRLFHFSLAISRLASLSHAAGLVLDLQAIAGRGLYDKATELHLGLVQNTRSNLTLGVRSNKSDHLDFGLKSDADLSTSSKFKLESSASFTSPAALAVAQTLSCVHSVAVWLDCDPACACAAGEVLSRLALLPPVAEVRFAMRAAEFSCSDGSADPRVHTPKVDAFAERAWAALPGVGNGSARSVCPEWG
ncbi:hypothetical protein C8R43DRAFT_1164206 [Mycena crocata]|nr:hypothetical protein C8R43DRAFT_1164206 [Mycena crocata]